MESSDTRILGIVTAAIVLAMTVALIVLRAQAIEHHQPVGQPATAGASFGLDTADGATMALGDAVSGGN